MREKNPSMEFANKTALAYSAVCKPLCQELGLPQTAFDILLFLANNPTYKTASDIVEVRHIKANLVSVNVDKLVHEGLLTRCPVPNDRRKTELLCTKKAQPIIQRGRALQEAFFDRLLNGIDEARLNVFYGTLEQMGRNLDEILEGEL
jgi:DNA-binding MarR family transcriptional regulator